MGVWEGRVKVRGSPGQGGGNGEEVEWAGSHYYSYSYFLFIGRLSPEIVAAHNIGTNYSGLRFVCWPAYTCEDRPTPLKSPDLELTDLISTRLLWGLNNTVNLISATRCSGCAIQSPAMLLLVFSKHPAGSLSLDHVHFAESYALNDFIRWMKNNIALMCVLLLGFFAYFWVFAYRWKVTKVILGAYEINNICLKYDSKIFIN